MENCEPGVTGLYLSMSFIILTSIFSNILKFLSIKTVEWWRILSLKIIVKGLIVVAFRYSMNLINQIYVVSIALAGKFFNAPIFK